MQRSDAYFLSTAVVFLVVCTVNGFWVRAVPAEALQMGFMLVLLLPLVWPQLGRWVGVDPLWSGLVSACKQGGHDR